MLSKQQLLVALPGCLSVTFCPYMSFCCPSKALYACFWEQSDPQSLLLFASSRNAKKHCCNRGILRDKISVQNDLLASEQFFSITLSLKDNVSVSVVHGCICFLDMSINVKLKNK